MEEKINDAISSNNDNGTTNDTQPTSANVDEYESGKWEMTTLEKASIPMESNDSRDEGNFNSCILSQSSVDAQMEKVINNIVELDDCQPFNHTLDQKDEDMDKDKEVEHIQREIIAVQAATFPSIEIEQEEQREEATSNKNDEENVVRESVDAQEPQVLEVETESSKPEDQILNEKVEINHSDDLQREKPIIEAVEPEQPQVDEKMDETAGIDQQQPGDEPVVEFREEKEPELHQEKQPELHQEKQPDILPQEGETDISQEKQQDMPQEEQPLPDLKANLQNMDVELGVVAEEKLLRESDVSSFIDKIDCCEKEDSVKEESCPAPASLVFESPRRNGNKRNAVIKPAGKELDESPKRSKATPEKVEDDSLVEPKRATLPRLILRRERAQPPPQKKAKIQTNEHRHDEVKLNTTVDNPIDIQMNETSEFKNYKNFDPIAKDLKCPKCQYHTSRINNLVYHVKRDCVEFKDSFNLQVERWKKTFQSPKRNNKRFTR